MNEDIKLTDFHRIFIGKAPTEFLLEVLVRTILVYLVFFMVMRLLGKRMNGQLTVTEMVLILTLGAIISVPMQAVDKGLIQGMVVLICALIFQRTLSWFAFKNAGFAKLTQGSAKILIKDGVLQMGELRKNRVSQELIFSKLRSENIFNLGQVKRLYVEAAGLYSIYLQDDEKPGLSTLPDPDSNIISGQKKAEGILACSICGTTLKNKEKDKCPNCSEKRWTSAVI